MNHYFSCAMLNREGYAAACTCGAPASFKNSDEALAALRQKLAGDSGKDSPIILTIYTENGSQIIHNVNESSIVYTDAKLTFEDDDNSSNCRIYTFLNVIGYSSTFR